MRKRFWQIAAVLAVLSVCVLLAHAKATTVADASPYRAPVSWAWSRGLLDDIVEDRLFEPERAITSEEAAMISREAESGFRVRTEYDTYPVATEQITIILESSDVDHYYTKAYKIQPLQGGEFPNLYFGAEDAGVREIYPLMPGEEVELTCDVSDQTFEPGIYEITVFYQQISGKTLSYTAKAYFMIVENSLM